MDEMLLKLIEVLENASPMIWDTLLRQVYIQAISYAVWAVVLAVICILSAYASKKAWSHREEAPYDTDTALAMLSVIFAISSPICGVFALVNLDSAIRYLANPNYYAIMLILQQLQ